ncbi:esterase [Nocardia sp. 2]|uniref:Esterase n=1 Tax=Nocardia acididurans TaxID=2802282 RepID=A0ABS1M2J6_9NOCA|nr:alpha/beta hydrolase-fold protein [Nocardia acididurans]MBL1073358.1 esterase [Nocardia acididurans]
MAVTGGPAVAEPAAAVNSPAIRNVVWLTDRRVALWIDSPSMGARIQVQLLLARDWNRTPEARFPTLLMLDGLRATDDQSGWTKEAGAESFYADKNITVVLPVGGMSSFYTDWRRPDNGKTYRWETFLTKELPPLLDKEWRTSNVRGILGLSMGGTAAMTLAGRNPGFARYVASFSGLLTTTTLGMPQAIGYAMRDAGGYDADAMWGPPTDAEWAAHDPYALAEKLKGASIYVSSGSGLPGVYDIPDGIPGVSANWAGMALEVLSRLSSLQFVAKLNKLSIPVQINYRPSGTHSWPYWDFEMRQSWPQAAAALGVEAAKPDCAAGGEILVAALGKSWLGDCLTGEFPVPGGAVQDFRGGRVLWSATTGAHAVGGMIGGAYQGASGPAGTLGFPTTDETAISGGGARQDFQRGYITFRDGKTEIHAS